MTFDTTLIPAEKRLTQEQEHKRFVSLAQLCSNDYELDYAQFAKNYHIWMASENHELYPLQADMIQDNYQTFYKWSAQFTRQSCLLDISQLPTSTQDYDHLFTEQSLHHVKQFRLLLPMPTAPLHVTSEAQMDEIHSECQKMLPATNRDKFMAILWLRNQLFRMQVPLHVVIKECSHHSRLVPSLTLGEMWIHVLSRYNFYTIHLAHFIQRNTQP